MIRGEPPDARGEVPHAITEVHVRHRAALRRGEYDGVARPSRHQRRHALHDARRDPHDAVGFLALRPLPQALAGHHVDDLDLRPGPVSPVPVQAVDLPRTQPDLGAQLDQRPPLLSTSMSRCARKVSRCSPSATMFKSGCLLGSAGRGRRPSARRPRMRSRRAEGEGRRACVPPGRRRRDPDPAVGRGRSAAGRGRRHAAAQRAAPRLPLVGPGAASRTAY